MSTAPAASHLVSDSRGPAIIGKSVMIKGQIFSREDLTIDGEVEGSVELHEHRLTVGPHGKLQAGDAATVERTLKRFGIVWTIFAPGAQTVATLDREPGWRRLYSDAYAVVHVRDEAGPEAAGLRGD